MGYKKGSHSITDLKYHIIWCTKYRYKVLEGEIGERVRHEIRGVCKANYVEIQKGHVRPDHVHLLVTVPANLAVSKLVQYIKGKSSRKLLMEYKELNKRYWGQHLWARGYFAVTVGNLNEKQIEEYISNQGTEPTDDDFKVSS